MLKRSLLYFCTLSLFLCGTALAKAPLVASGNTNAPPLSWEEYKKLTGIGPDLITHILTDLGVDHSIQIAGNWSQVQEKAKNGSVDLIVGAFQNDNRKTYLDFSIPYLAEPTVIITEKGKEFTFENWDDLIGKRGVTNIGESYGQAFDNHVKTKLDVKYIALERAIQLMNSGEADYLIMDLYTALIYARMLRGEDAITILKKPVVEESFHIAIAKNSPYASLMPEINKELQKAIDNKDISRLFYMHFDNWKELIAKRSGFFKQDANIRAEENVEFVQYRDDEDKARLVNLIGSRDGLPYSAE